MQETESETASETISAMRAAHAKEMAELKAMYEARDRQTTEEVGTFEHVQDSLYAHGTSVPQDATEVTIAHLDADPMNTFYMSPSERAELIGVANPNVNAEEYTHILVRDPTDPRYRSTTNRVREVLRRSRGAAFTLKNAIWDETDLVTMAVPKSMIAERDAENEAYRQLRESGQHLIPADERATAAGMAGYVGSHKRYPNGRDPLQRAWEDVRAESAQNRHSGMIGPTAALNYNDIMQGRVRGFDAQRIQADEDKYRGGARHQSMSREQVQEIVTGTLRQNFSAGAVGFGPQTTRERTATLAAAREQRKAAR